MISIARFSLCILCSLKVSFSLGQLHLDSSAKKAYDSVFKKLPSKQKQQLLNKEDSKSNEHGWALFSEYSADTLNKTIDTTVKYAEVQLEYKDPITGKWGKANSATKKDAEQVILFCDGFLSKDTLFIQVGGLFPDEWIEHITTQKTVNSFYCSQLRDFKYKMDVNDSLRKSLVIPSVTIIFNLSDTSFKVGKIVYGNAEIKTGIFYKKDDWYNDKFDKIQLNFTYYFKFKVRKKLD